MVVAIVVLLATLVMPAFTKMLQSNRESTAKVMVRTLLARAQAHAVAHQKYAGVRFQFDSEGWEIGRQYMVLIEKADVSGNEYVAVADEKTVALPEGIGVLSADVIDRNDFNYSDLNLDDSDLTANEGDGEIFSLNGAVTLSIVFSPTGQLVIKDVVTMPRQPYFDVDGNYVFDSTINHADRVFLDSSNVDRALLFCDGYIWLNFEDSTSGFNGTYDPQPWLAAKESATGVYLFDVEAMAEVEPDFRYSQYVQDLEPLLVNRYTGGLIEEE